MHVCGELIEVRLVRGCEVQLDMGQGDKHGVEYPIARAIII